MLRSVRPIQLRVRLGKDTLSSAGRHAYKCSTSNRYSFYHRAKGSVSYKSTPISFLVAKFRQPGKFPLRNAASNFSSKGAAAGDKTGSSRRSYVWYFAKILKILRIPLVVTSVYVLGYQQGIVDYSRNPVEKRRELMERILSGVGCDDPDKILCMQEGAQLKAFLARTSMKYAVQKRTGKNGYEEGADRQMQLRNIASIADRIVKSSKAFVDGKLREIDMESQPLEYEKWSKAKERVGNDYTNWHFVLIDVPVPNAFVSESMPQTIFVTTALLENFVDNDDELGLILGHEVSHLIHGHMSERNSSALTLSIIEVLLLSLDPTEGLMSVFIVTAIASLKSLLDANFSRETEKEADDLGIVLAARACFDTYRAPLVFKKMHDHNLEQSNNNVGLMNRLKRIESEVATESVIENVEDDHRVSQEEETADSGNWTNIMSTHPPDLERYSNLMLASKIENPKKYSHCSDIKRNFLKSLSMRN